MGMSASQARFLSLTARKTNVEYEGQQINQQRTALSNESSNYYSQLTSLAVPTPPSSSDYTKISYTFEDGSEMNTVTSLIATKDTKETGIYMLNYVQETPTNNMIVQGTSVVQHVNGLYYIGDDELQNAATSVQNSDGTWTLSKAFIDDSPSEEKMRQHLIKAGIPESIVNNYSSEEIKRKLTLEKQYATLAIEKYSEAEGYKVRYVQNSATGVYEPVFYSETDLDPSRTDYDAKTNMSLTGIKGYIFGETTDIREIKDARARVEKDSSGRYMAIVVYANDADANANINGKYYNLTSTTEADDAGYNDAMNQYYYKKAEYDQTVQEINAKIEIIQVQDKNLELKLKQLDTEQNAIQTEMDAVKKVISKNVESSFKTFNA